MASSLNSDYSPASAQQRILGWVLFTAFVVIFVRHQVHLLDYMHWEDESETIVASKLMADGARLYKDFFNHHGPLTFFPGWLIEKVGDFGVAGHRVIIAVGQWIALLALVFSPEIRSRRLAAVYACFAGAVMALYLPQKFGHMYMYQVMAGLFLVIALTQYVLPSICGSSRVRNKHVILGNLLLASLPFFAVTYAPASVLLILASLRRHQLRLTLVTIAIGGLLNIGFLLYAGSIPGYLAYHFYMNAEILPLYNGGQSLVQLVYSILKSATDNLEYFILFCMTALALAQLIRRESTFPWRTVLLGGGIASLLMRGGELEFHRLSYIYALLALVPLLFHRSHEPVRYSWLPAAAIYALVVLKLLIVLPEDRDRFDRHAIPERTEFSELARLVTTKDERIIAYAFRNLEYLLADRKPASGNYFYFPWQRKYNESPILGVSIDTCEQISSYQPKLMMIDKVDVYGRHSWESYGGCVQSLMDRDYTKVANRPFYLRNDINLERLGLGREDDHYTVESGERLNAAERITLKLKHDEAVRISGLSLHTVRKNADHSDRDSYIRVTLVSNDGKTTTVDSRLDARSTQSRHHVSVKPGFYQSATVRLVDSDRDVRLLESRDKDGHQQACIVYDYVLGGRHFTPGCPLL
jgi:hypothetical protein